MQALLVIPDSSILQKFAGGERILTREIAGVPLLIRVIATARRAGVDSLLIVWPPDVDRSIWAQCAASPLLRGLEIAHVVRGFDPREAASWTGIAETLQDQFYWLPWNWATHKRALAELAPESVQPESWDTPALLEKEAVVGNASSPSTPAESRLQAKLPAPLGILITSENRIADAERFLVANSGKATDGIYSRFNRFLCRPAVRLLTHTPVTPNWVTLGGLVVGIAAAFMYARGFYAAYVAGALLFFLSGLFDDADGMLARVKFRESVFGTWFEGFVDETTYVLLFSGITAGLYRERGPRELTYGYLLIIGCVLSIAVTRLQRKLATRPDRPHEYAGRLNRLLEDDSSNLVSRVVRQIHIFIKKGVAIHYLVIFTVLGGLPWLLRLAALGANLTWTLALYFNFKFFRRGKPGAVVQNAHIA
jgi:phosphatidylglycerophosphate synthase